MTKMSSEGYIGYSKVTKMSSAWFISPVTATSGYGKHKEYAVA